MSQVKINVTQQDITDGSRGSAQNCAIARAIQRELDRRDRQGIEVTNSHIRVDGKLYKQPQKGSQFVSRFDHRKSVKPFSFMLREDKTPATQVRSSSFGYTTTGMWYTRLYGGVVSTTYNMMSSSWPSLETIIF